MLIKLGVDISRLNRGIRRSLSTIEKVYRQMGDEAVITSTFEGNHSPSSLHYCNDAVDIRLPHKLESLGKLLGVLQENLGADYDVVGESNHIHIEYDPKF